VQFDKVQLPEVHKHSGQQVVPVAHCHGLALQPGASFDDEPHAATNPKTTVPAASDLKSQPMPA
jgi:hypothetical protein